MTYPAADSYIPWQGLSVYPGNAPRYVVIHVGQGWMSTWDNWARVGEESRSFHYGVGLGGLVHQYLRHDQGGAHAGGQSAVLHPVLRPWNANVLTIGVEHEGFSSGRDPQGAPVDQWNDAQLTASADLVRFICQEENIPMTREFIIGHYEIATDRADDPGPLFQWDKYMALVVKEDEMTPKEKAAFEALVATVAGHEHRLLRIEVDEVSDQVPDAWLGPTLTEMRERLEELEEPDAALVAHVANHPSTPVISAGEHVRVVVDGVVINGI